VCALAGADTQVGPYVCADPPGRRDTWQAWSCDPMKIVSRDGPSWPT
jgi:hypothetical protein